MRLGFHTLAVTTSVLANDLLPGVTDTQVPSLRHPDFPGHASILHLSSLFAPFQLLITRFIIMVSITICANFLKLWGWHFKAHLRVLQKHWQPAAAVCSAPPGRMGGAGGLYWKKYAAFCSQETVLGVKGSYSSISPLSPPVFKNVFFPRLLWR